MESHDAKFAFGAFVSRRAPIWEKGLDFRDDNNPSTQTQTQTQPNPSQHGFSFSFYSPMRFRHVSVTSLLIEVKAARHFTA